MENSLTSKTVAPRKGGMGSVDRRLSGAYPSLRGGGTTRSVVGGGWPLAPDSHQSIDAMQWDGEGLLIGVRRHGETSVIVEVMVASATCLCNLTCHGSVWKNFSDRSPRATIR